MVVSSIMHRMTGKRKQSCSILTRLCSWLALVWVSPRLKTSSGVPWTHAGRRGHIPTDDQITRENCSGSYTDLRNVDDVNTAQPRLSTLNSDSASSKYVVNTTATVSAGMKTAVIIPQSRSPVRNRRQLSLLTVMNNNAEH